MSTGEFRFDLLRTNPFWDCGVYPYQFRLLRTKSKNGFVRCRLDGYPLTSQDVAFELLEWLGRA